MEQSSVNQASPGTGTIEVWYCLIDNNGTFNGGVACVEMSSNFKIWHFLARLKRKRKNVEIDDIKVFAPNQDLSDENEINPRLLGLAPVNNRSIIQNVVKFDPTQAGVIYPLIVQLPIVLPDDDNIRNSHSQPAFVANQGAINDQPFSLSQKLDSLGIKYTNADMTYLMNVEHSKYVTMKQSSTTLSEMKEILDYVKRRIKSQTRIFIGEHYDFLLDGSLNASSGQSKSSFYYAFSSTGQVHAAKIYHTSTDEFAREVDANSKFDHDNIAKFVTSFTISGDRQVIIMPFYPRTAHDLLLQRSKIKLKTIAWIAHDVYLALEHIHSKKYCYSDVKPSNIALCNFSSKAVLIDFGSTTSIGSQIIETTDLYTLDSQFPIATEFLDWFCFGTTLGELAGVDIHLHKNTTLFREAVANIASDSLKQLIISCVSLPDSETIKSAVDRFVIEHK